MDHKLLAGAVVLALAGGLFYWYEYRPSQIRSACAAQAEELAAKDTKEIVSKFLPGDLLGEGFFSVEMRDNYYQACLQRNGLAQ